MTACLPLVHPPTRLALTTHMQNPLSCPRLMQHVPWAVAATPMRTKKTILDVAFAEALNDSWSCSQVGISMNILLGWVPLLLQLLVLLLLLLCDLQVVVVWGVELERRRRTCQIKLGGGNDVVRFRCCTFAVERRRDNLGSGHDKECKPASFSFSSY